MQLESKISNKNHENLKKESRKTEEIPYVYDLFPKIPKTQTAYLKLLQI